jgi:hypothetical protein
LFIDDHQASADDRPYRMDGAYVDEGYFDVLGLEIVAGRPILATDRDGGLRVAVVTRTMAERYWPGEDAVGREFRRDWGGEPWTIVGVVEDYRVDTPGESPKPYLHLPQRTETTYGNILVRTATDAAPMVPGLERELRALDPDLVFLDTGTIWNLAEVRIFPVRAGAWLIGAFGVLALVLAAVGLYGVIGYSVSRRLREIGIRLTLGGEPSGIRRMVLLDSARLALFGAALGALAAWYFGRALASLLFRTSPTDPLTWVVVLGMLIGTTLVAAWIPARRATRVDPREVLRAE